jgi:MFS family permease
MVLPSLGTSIANVALPELASVFAVSFSEVRWVVLAYLVANTVLVVVAGGLGDVLGRKRLLLAGIALFFIASLLCGLSPSLWLLVAARAVQGFAAAILMALSMALVATTAAKGQTGRAMGLLGTASAIGTALGPSIGGALLSHLDWRAIFLVNVPLAAVALLLAWRHLPDDGPMPAAARRWAPFETKLLRDGALKVGLARTGLTSTVLMATLVVGPFYLTGTLGLDIAAVGIVMSLGPIVAALSGAPAGRLVDRLGASRMTLAGLGTVAAGCLALALLPTAAGIAGYVLPIGAITAGYALFQAANNTAVMAGAAADQRGAISGLLNLARNAGLIAGTSAMGAVFASAAGTSLLQAAPPQAVATGLHVTFAVATGLIVLAIAIAPQGRWRARQWFA